MAMILIGKTQCALCGKVLMTGEEITGLPPSANHSHPLYKYFDEGFHLACFDNWDKKEEVLAVVEKERTEYINSDYYKEMMAKYGEAIAKLDKPNEE